MYQYTIEAPKDIESVQITGTFDNWSKSLPEITTPPFEQTIILDDKQDIIFKFIINGNWTTLDSYPTVTDEHGNTNNIVHAEHLILVEEEKDEEIKEDDGLKEKEDVSGLGDSPVVLAVTDGDHTFDNIGKSEANKDVNAGATDNKVNTKSLKEEENIKRYAGQTKNEPLASQNATGINPTSSSSSFAAVSSPPTSSDFENIAETPSPDPDVQENKQAESAQAAPVANASTANKSSNAAVPGDKPEKPTLLAHPSESTLRAPHSSGSQTPVVASSSSSIATPDQEDSPQAPRIPGSFDGRPSVERTSSGGKREGLISKFKSLFR